LNTNSNAFKSIGSVNKKEMQLVSLQPVKKDSIIVKDSGLLNDFKEIE